MGFRGEDLERLDVQQFIVIKKNRGYLFWFKTGTIYSQTFCNCTKLIRTEILLKKLWWCQFMLFGKSYRYAHETCAEGWLDWSNNAQSVKLVKIKLYIWNYIDLSCLIWLFIVSRIAPVWEERHFIIIGPFNQSL